MNDFSKIKEEIDRAGSIVILNHINMDGDAVGSAFSLADALSSKGKTVKVALEEKPPKYLEGLCGDYILSSDEVFDLAICVDCGDTGRLGVRRDMFTKAKRTVCIDHHVSNTGFADINYIKPGASSTSEIIFELLNYLELPISKKAAEQLFAGIITDTGGFEYSNTTPESFIYSGALLKLGADIKEVCIEIYESNSLSKLKLKSRCLDSIELYEDGKISASVLTKKDFEETGASVSDSEGFSQMGRGIDGVEASFFITAYDTVKVSLRSKRFVDVSKVAAHFGGGGHKMASGFTLPGDTDVDEIKDELIKMLSQAIRKGNEA